MPDRSFSMTDAKTVKTIPDHQRTEPDVCQQSVP